jgi:hypothetical protein
MLVEKSAFDVNPIETKTDSAETTTSARGNNNLCSWGGRGGWGRGGRGGCGGLVAKQLKGYAVLHGQK